MIKEDLKIIKHSKLTSANLLILIEQVRYHHSKKLTCKVILMKSLIHGNKKR